MITHLALQNWRSHENSEFKFGKGTNVLVGQMGSGKSAAINGICFGLFGSFPDLQQRKLKLDNVIMNKPKEKSNALVEVEFSVDGKSYAVKRHLQRGKGTTKSELYENNTLLEGPNSQRVTDRICEILKINYDLFSRAVYSEQNNIGYFLEIPKGKRREKIDELLRIGKFENARRNLGTVINRLKDRKNEREKFCFDKEEVKHISDLRKEIDEKKKAVDEKQKQIAVVKGQKDSVEKEYKTLSGKIGKEKDEIRNTEGKINSLKQEKERINGILERSNTLFQENMRKMEELKTVDIDADKRLKRQIDETNTEINRFTERKGSIASCINEIDDNLGRLGGDKCPVCDSELSDKKISEIKDKKEHDKTKHSEQLKEIESKVKSMRESLVEKEKLFSTISSKIEEKKILNKNIVDLEKEIKKVSQEREQVTKEMDQEMKKFDKRSVEETLKMIKEKEKQEKELYGKLKDLEKSVDLGLQGINSLNTLIDEKKKRLDELEKVKDEIEKSKKEVAYLGETVNAFQIFQKTLQEAQTTLRHDFTDNVNVALVDVWRKIYPYQDYTDLRLGIDDSGDYILQLKPRAGEWTNVEGITSGGERSTACLVLRVALSLVLTQNLSWLVLDEPTHNLDKNAIRDLAKTLKDYLPQVVEQIFIITHEEELESAASGFLYRLQRKKEEDEPTRVVLESSID